MSYTIKKEEIKNLLNSGQCLIYDECGRREYLDLKHCYNNNMDLNNLKKFIKLTSTTQFYINCNLAINRILRRFIKWSLQFTI